MSGKDVSDQLDKILAALANESRRGMIHQLAFRPATISQLAKPLGLSLPAMHKHIKVLEDAKLIRRQKSGRSNFIALNPEGLGLAREWLSRYQTYWGNNKETLENYIASLPE
jgi:DNA-binding transcriptional ArsR family regulator